jgi:hypothetical protein
LRGFFIFDCTTRLYYSSHPAFRRSVIHRALSFLSRTTQASPRSLPLVRSHPPSLALFHTSHRIYRSSDNVKKLIGRISSESQAGRGIHHNDYRQTEQDRK